MLLETSDPLQKSSLPPTALHMPSYRVSHCLMSPPNPILLFDCPEEESPRKMNSFICSNKHFINAYCVSGTKRGTLKQAVDTALSSESTDSSRVDGC